MNVLVNWRVWSRSAPQQNFHVPGPPSGLPARSSSCVSQQLGLIPADTGSCYINSKCCGAGGDATLPAARAPRSAAFKRMPVMAASWPSASSAASRHWLLFLRASVTIDVISDSQPWKKEIHKCNPSAPTSLIKINLPVNQCQQPGKRTSVGWRDGK